MTQEEIQERNKQIALMLGWKNLNDDSFPEFINAFGDFYSLKELKFHSDWNWLMEAVDYIYGTVGCRKYSYSHEEHSRCVFTDMSIVTQTHNFGGGNIITDSGKQATEKEAVFIAVSDLAKHYNEGKL